MTIGRRFRGPLTSGNGGYSAGALARHVAADVVEVTLRLPPPLERPLAVERRDGGAVLLDGDAVVAEAHPAELELALPQAVSWDEAAAASRRFDGTGDPVFAECFVCGHRDDGSGLELHAGRVAGREPLVAAPWLAREVSFEVVWAAIDCPGAYAVEAVGRGVAVLGRMTARVARLPREGERCVVVAWPLGADGRKLDAGTALYGEDGAACAYARQVWILPKAA